jgi:hypothetical protein
VEKTTSLILPSNRAAEVATMSLGVLAGIALGAGAVLATQSYYASRQPPANLTVRGIGRLAYTIPYSPQDTYFTLQQKVKDAVPTAKGTELTYDWDGRYIGVPIEAPLTENQYPFFRERLHARSVYCLTTN